MFDISKYLEKFRLISKSRTVSIVTIKEVIKNICDIDLEDKRINVKDGIARISERPIIKTAIFLKKKEILEELNKTIKIRDLL